MEQATDKMVVGLKEELEVTESQIENAAWTQEDEKRIRRRLDLKLMPIIFGLYLLCFVDR